MQRSLMLWSQCCVSVSCLVLKLKDTKFAANKELSVARLVCRPGLPPLFLRALWRVCAQLLEQLGGDLRSATFQQVTVR